MKNQENGMYGEEQACQFLVKQGYTILARNYAVRYGELDIIAKLDAYVVFVEVKTRKNAQFAAARDAVTKAKQKRLIAAAQMWLAETGYDGKTRFDVIEVYPNEVLHHISDAFWCEEGNR